MPGQKTIAVVGAGSFGSALASLLSSNHYQVTLYGRDQDVIDDINIRKQNSRYLPGVQLHPELKATSDWSHIKSADFVLLTVPSHAMRSVCRELGKTLSNEAVVVHATKGLEADTLERMSEVILGELTELSHKRLAVLSGPSHAEELSRGLPTTMVVASPAKSTAELVQDVFMSPRLRVYTNPDVVGVELGGSLKNIIALGCGISDGLQFGDNAKAALLTRGLVEITRLGVKMGASFHTFSGLAGVGDLIVTGTSKHSRNWNAGYLLGKGMSLKDTLFKVNMVVEGVKTTQAAVQLARKNHVHMPIAEAIYEVLFTDKSPRMAVEDLMGRSKRHEMEDIIEEKSMEWMYPS